MSTLEPIAIRAETLGDRVYAAIRDAIVARRLPPGERVTEAGLAAQLSVSKTPVREALLRLQQVGLVVAGDGQVRVVSPSSETILEAYEVRVALESESVLLASDRAGSRRTDTIAGLAQESYEAAARGDQDGFRALDRRFHLEIASGAANRRLMGAIEDALDLTSALRSRDVPHAHVSTDYARQHVAIAEAITAGEAQVARTRMRAHIEKVRDMVIDVYRSQ